jgi:multisubunit Na+/H+ antiporter MnhC subunit
MMNAIYFMVVKKDAINVILGIQINAHYVMPVIIKRISLI